MQLTKALGGNRSHRPRSRGSRRLMSLLAVVATTATLFITAGPASAASTTDQQRAVFLEVMNAPDPIATLKALSPSDQAIFDQAFQQNTPTLTDSRLVAAPVSTTAASGARPAAASAATRCWSYYYYYQWHDFGIHDGDSWMQLNWCGNGSSVSSASISQTGGRGLGVISYNGVNNKGIRSVGWEARGYVEFDFSITFDHVYPCQQVRGGDTGLYSTRASCNLN